MKILFISSGNSKSGISPIVKNQGRSLISAGKEVDFYTIIGTGLKGYIGNIKKLMKYIQNNEYDIYHAHFSLSAIVAALAGCRPLVVSLMGSDVNNGRFWNWINLLFALLFWDKVIVKSLDMYRKLGYKRAEVIPNGVAMDRFMPMSMEEARSKLDWDPNDKIVLFLSNPSRVEKNYDLAKLAIEKLQDVKLIPLIDVPHKHIPLYQNGANVLLLTSIYEGSPNIIKEAMACNCPIVSTNVGDVNWVLGDTDGCYVANFSPNDVSEKLKMALLFSEKKGKTKGRERILKLGLNSKLIANRIKTIYEDILNYCEI